MDYPKPDKPVAIALVGTGNRSKVIYQPLLPALLALLVSALA